MSDITSSTKGGFLSRERTVAKAGFNRWLVPPAALAIHLCIGMAYGFSVFWLPLSRAIGSFFIGLSKPPVPTRLFKSIDEALAWLRSIREKTI